MHEHNVCKELRHGNIKRFLLLLNALDFKTLAHRRLPDGLSHHTMLVPEHAATTIMTD